MSLWGNSDGVNLTGTVAISQNTVAVAGTSTEFTTEVDEGDLILIDALAYRVETITSDTALTITASFAPANVTGKTATKRETPRHLTVADSDAIYGVSVTGAVEYTGGADNVVSIAVDNAGTGYASAPTVTVAGNTTSVATVSATTGKVTALSVAGTNTSHSTAPAVTITAPVAKTFNGTSAVDPATDQITVTGHKMETGDAVTYTEGGTAVTGLVTATTYYVIVVDANTIKLAVGAELAAEGTNIDITVDGSNDNHSVTGVTATGAAALGSGSGSGANVAGPGWVKRTQGSGGRAGRVHYETLVAMSSISGDDNRDDTVFPE